MRKNWIVSVYNRVFWIHIDAYMKGFGLGFGIVYDDYENVWRIYLDLGFLHIHVDMWGVIKG